MNKGRPPRTIEQRLHNTSILSDEVVFERVTDVEGVRLIVSRRGIGWLSTVDLDEEKTAAQCNLSLLTPSDLTRLADALKPYQTPEPQPATTDRFCHTCGAKTVENKPRNDAPTFLSGREGHDPQQAAGIR